MADVPNNELRTHPDQLTGADFADAQQAPGPLTDGHLAEATTLLARLDAVPSMGHLDSADLGWVRPVLRDLLDEVRRLRGELGTANGAITAAVHRLQTAVPPLEAEVKRLRARPASVWWVKGDDVFPADPELHATERAAKDDAIRIYRDANQIDVWGDPVPDFAWRKDRDGGVELYADGTATGLIVRELAVKPPCAHSFPAPTVDSDPDAEGYGPGNCTGCGMTYRQYDAGHGERMAEALEGGA